MWRITQKIKNEFKALQTDNKGQNVAVKLVGVFLSGTVIFVFLEFKDSLDSLINPLLDNEVFGSAMKIIWNLIPLFMLVFIMAMLFTPGSERQEYPPQY